MSGLGHKCSGLSSVGKHSHAGAAARWFLVRTRCHRHYPGL